MYSETDTLPQVPVIGNLNYTPGKVPLGKVDYQNKCAFGQRVVSDLDFVSSLSTQAGESRVQDQASFLKSLDKQIIQLHHHICFHPTQFFESYEHFFRFIRNTVFCQKVLKTSGLFDFSELLESIFSIHMNHRSVSYESCFWSCGDAGA